MNRRYESLLRSVGNTDRPKIVRAPEPVGPGKYCDDAVPARCNSDGELVIPRYHGLEYQSESLEKR